MKEEDRIAIAEWQAYRQDFKSGITVNAPPTIAGRKAKLKELEANPIEWMKYFMPKFASKPFAQFQIDAINRILTHDEWFEVLSWSRELAKSTITMMCVLYLCLTGKKHNVILASATQDSAVKLLKPYASVLSKNGLIKAFYGDQIVFGSWKEDQFVAKCGASFFAIGAGNAPRGSRNESIRPDVLLVDDFDTDEDCRNENIVDKKWEWWEKALYPTRSISEPTTVIFCGNIIAQNCCVKRAGAMADHWDIVNIRDEFGHSTWPEKNSEEHIDRVLSKISAKAIQGEYFNNPIAEGKIFKNCAYGEIPPLKDFQFLICYGDPSYSNNKKSESSMKAMVLVGKIEKKYYIIKTFCDHCTNAEFIDAYFDMQHYVDKQTTLYCYMENNKLQDPFFQQVFKPLLRTAQEERKETLHIVGDERKKTDKATRIEANLEPLDREGLLIFNHEEMDNPYMRELINQFKLFDMRLSYKADGPDAVEGAVTLWDLKVRSMEQPIVMSYHDLGLNSYGF